MEVYVQYACQLQEHELQAFSQHNIQKLALNGAIFLSCCTKKNIYIIALSFEFGIGILKFVYLTVFPIPSFWVTQQDCLFHSDRFAH